MVNSQDTAMKLYRLLPKEGANPAIYDIYVGAVVAARSEEQARSIHPRAGYFWGITPTSLLTGWYEYARDEVGNIVGRVAELDDFAASEWVDEPTTQLDVKFLGVASDELFEPCVVLVSFAAS
jgi:hypothetical protein